VVGGAFLELATTMLTTRVRGSCTVVRTHQGNGGERMMGRGNGRRKRTGKGRGRQPKSGRRTGIGIRTGEGKGTYC
jgi:hypothetical protein